MPPEKRTPPEITWENIRPPYLDYHYFQGIDLYPFRPQATAFDMVNAYWLSEAATLAYAEEDFATPIFQGAGFTEIKFFSGNSTQCYVVSNDDFLILVFRGTEVRPRPDDPNFLNIIEDILTDADALLGPVDSGQVGKVHQGFKKALDEVWDRGENSLYKYIKNKDNGKRTLWFTGHSLGAALATLAAQRYGNGVRLYTYGSPRVGDMAFKNAFPLKNYRFVNDRDIVTRIPPRPLYQHVGECEFIDSHGSIHKDSDSCEEEKPDIQAKIESFIKSVDKRSTIVDSLIPEEILNHVPTLYSTYIWNNIP